MVRDDVANNRESETRATCRAATRLVDPIETLENSLMVFGGDADALVDHRDTDEFCSGASVDDHRRAAPAVFDGVRDEIFECRHEL